MKELDYTRALTHVHPLLALLTELRQHSVLQYFAGFSFNHVGVKEVVCMWKGEGLIFWFSCRSKSLNNFFFFIFQYFVIQI